MATVLRNMSITKIALVDEGSCSEANITMIKRKGDVQNMEELLKSLTEDQRKLVEAEIAKGAELAKAKEDLEKAQADLEEEKKKKEKPVAGKDEKPDFFKGMPEEVRKRFEGMEAIIKASQVREVETEAIAKAKTLTNMPSTQDEIVNVYKSAKGVSEEFATQVMDMLSKANSLIEKSKAFEQTSTGQEGNAGASTDDAWLAIEKAAEPIMKARSITKEAATDAVLKEQPELYKNYLASMK